ncbi:MAG: hydantoinase/oxoprolinase family protein [Chromatiales bacterium]|jgi:N-methylhydantoinase A
MLQKSINSRVNFLGVDTGGTFTDFVFYDGVQLRIHKVLSTPDAPERAILQGIRDLDIPDEELRLIHGSTVATNAVLEGKGVRTLFITNRGFGDLLTIGRQSRAELYNLQPEILSPPVPADLCVETGGRLDASGQVINPLTGEDLEELWQAVRQKQPRAIAVNLLFSWKDGSLERRIREALPDDLFVSLSSEVLPEIREYERGIATWLNAWVGPLVEGYVKRLRSGLPRASLSIIQSSGDTMDAAQASNQAVRMLLSGPAGGLVGASWLGELAGDDRLLTFDMGGTSTDVSLIDGAPQLTNEGHIGRWPVAVSMVDMHTIGAGGGSIARLDAGGMLQVGPESAGADPGPACYGQGGTEVTVSDANLVLGRLRPGAFLGGRMHLDADAAEASMQRLANAMKCSVTEAARGVITVANEHMAAALRMISVERGVDPKEYRLLSFGGAGGLHVCSLAEALGMRRAMVPVHAGVLSALGMLATRPGRELSRTWQGVLSERDKSGITEAFGELECKAVDELLKEGIAREELECDYSLDLRYRGQSNTLNVAWQDIDACESAFHLQHEMRYGHRLDVPVEMLNLRVRVRAAATRLSLKPQESRRERQMSGVEMPGYDTPVRSIERAALEPGDRIEGPALILEEVSTTWLSDGWHCLVDPCGNLLLEQGSAI